MAELTLFYSWQSDLQPALSRNVISDATKQALKRVRADAEVEDSPRLDHDTKGVSGAPEIAGTIFSKIDGCGIFLADLSFVGSIQPCDGGRTKHTPNPNVLFELGYALAKVGWERVVLVMNKSFGEPDDLIFDLRNRRHPITFDYDSSQDRKTVTGQLSTRIEEAIRACLQADHAAAAAAILKLDPGSLEWMVQYGKHGGFRVGQRTSMGAVLTMIGRDASVSRMLDLGLIHARIESTEEAHTYDWTYLGKRVIEQLSPRLKIGSA